MSLVFTLYGAPRTKKNSINIVVNRRTGKVLPMPSKAYREYEKACLKQLPEAVRTGINRRINLKCVYYMPTHRKVDLVNLLEATCDILRRANVIADDNSGIVAAHDGSCVMYDKDNPRVEIEITLLDDSFKAVKLVEFEV